MLKVEPLPKASAPAKSARKKLYAVHSWLGFHLALIMALVLLTGTIATVSHEIDWLIQDDMRVVPDAEKVSWGAMEEALYAHAPGHTIVSLAQMEGDHFAYRARMIDTYGRHRFVHVNQWTGAVTGETHPLTVQRVFRDLHRYLFMPNYVGLPLVTSLGFVLAVSLYTGLKTARKWPTLMTRLRTNRGARVFWGDAHKAAGLWGSWFFVVIIVTAVWYLFEFILAASAPAALGAPSAHQTRLSTEQVDRFGAVIRDADLDTVIEAAQGAYPGLNVQTIRYPTSASALFVVQGEVGNPLVRKRANAVYLHPETLDVLHVRQWRASSLVFILNNMADPLHFGFFGGLPTKLIWFVFGLAMTGLSATGVWLTWRRLRPHALSKAQFATMPVLIVSMIFCTSWYERLQGPSIPHAEDMTGEARLPGGLVARLHVARNADGQRTGLIRSTLSSTDGRPAVKRVTLTLGDRELGEDAKALGRTVETRFVIDPSQSATKASARVTYHYRDGTVATAHWTL